MELEWWFGEIVVKSEPDYDYCFKFKIEEVWKGIDNNLNENIRNLKSVNSKMNFKKLVLKSFITYVNIVCESHETYLQKVRLQCMYYSTFVILKIYSA